MAPHDPFSTLPSPILLTIVKLIPDLSSFRSLDKASLTVASIFDECGAEITEAIMFASLSEQVRNLIRAIAILRSDFVLSKSLDEFLNTYLSRERDCEAHHLACLRRTNPAPDQRSEACSRCGVTPRSFIIAASTPPKILRGILDSAFQIQNLADSCLRTMIDRCMALEPSHLLDSSYRYIYRPAGNNCPQRRPLGQRYQPGNSGPPSWVEEQRTCRALWLLQLFFDLKAATAISLFHWSYADTVRFENSDVETFCKDLEKKSYRSSSCEQFITVVEFCQELEPKPKVISVTQSPGHLLRLPHVSTVHWTVRPAPQFAKSFDIDDQTLGYLTLSEIALGGRSPLMGVDLANFRRLGCYIWDRERLATLGLLDYRKWPPPLPGQVVLSESNHWFTWESLLGTELIELRERKRLEQLPESLRRFGSSKKVGYWYDPLNRCPQ